MPHIARKDPPRLLLHHSCRSKDANSKRRSEPNPNTHYGHSSNLAICAHSTGLGAGRAFGFMCKNVGYTHYVIIYPNYLLLLYDNKYKLFKLLLYVYSVTFGHLTSSITTVYVTSLSSAFHVVCCLHASRRQRSKMLAWKPDIKQTQPYGESPYNTGEFCRGIVTAICLMHLYVQSPSGHDIRRRKPTWRIGTPLINSDEYVCTLPTYVNLLLMSGKRKMRNVWETCGCDGGLKVSSKRLKGRR